MLRLYGLTMITTVVWDFGNVLIEWDPRNLYRKHFATDAAMEEFLSTVWTESMNARLDSGERLADLIEELVAAHPHHAELIALYDTRWTEMLGPQLPGSLELVRELATNGVAQYGLSNWSTETFIRAVDDVPAFAVLDGRVLSAEVGVCKPEPAIYRALLDRFALDAASCVFIDDRLDNCEGARAQGMTALRFTDVPSLRRDLNELGVPVTPP